MFALKPVAVPRPSPYETTKTVSVLKARDLIFVPYLRHLPFEQKVKSVQWTSITSFGGVALGAHLLEHPRILILAARAHGLGERWSVAFLNCLRTYSQHAAIGKEPFTLFKDLPADPVRGWRLTDDRDPFVVERTEEPGLQLTSINEALHPIQWVCALKKRPPP